MKIGLDIRPREGKTEMWSGGPAFLESLTARGKVEASLEPAEWEYVLLSDEIGCWNKASILAAITSEGASMEVLEIVAGLFRGYVESDCPSDSIGPLLGRARPALILCDLVAVLQFEDPAPTTAELTEWIGNWAEWPSDPRLGHELTATFPNELRASVITELETSGTASSATTRLLTDLMSIDEGDPAELGARLMATSYERELRRAVEPQRPPTSIGADASSELARLRSFLHLLLRARARGLLTAVALAARERLTQDFLHSAGLGAAQFASVQASVSVELELAAARVTLGQLGTFDCSWDGSEEGLYTLVAGLAQAFSDAYKEDRARYGTAPWG